MQKQILVICPYPEGLAASQRLKYEQYFEGWKEAGYSIKVSSFFDEKEWRILYKEGNFFKKIFATIKGYIKRIKDLLSLRDFDVIYICMWAAPLFDRFFETLIIRYSKRVVFDFDDSIHLEIDPNIDKFYKRLFKGRGKIQYLIKNSNYVITSSPFNLDYCKVNNVFSSANYIPCSLDANKFKPKTTNNMDRKITLGWTGTFTSKNYLDSIRDLLIKACDEFNLKLILITNFDYHLPDIDIEVIYWNKDTEIEDLQRIDIGLYPLLESKWALGKGGLKVLQYMSIGIPSISSNFGTAQRIIDHEVNGYLASDEDEWFKYISKLVASSSLRQNMGALARKKFIEEYSTHSNLPKYLEALQGS